MSQEKSKTMPIQIFWRVKEMYYGIVQVENLKPGKLVKLKQYLTSMATALIYRFSQA